MTPVEFLESCPAALAAPETGPAVVGLKDSLKPWAQHGSAGSHSSGTWGAGC